MRSSSYAAFSGVKDRSTKKATDTDDLSFAKAFKQFKDEGRKTFTWRGKKYSTKTKAEEARKKESQRCQSITQKPRRSRKGKIAPASTKRKQARACKRGSPPAEITQSSKWNESCTSTPFFAQIRRSTSLTGLFRSSPTRSATLSSVTILATERCFSTLSHSHQRLSS